jgi:transposase
MTLARELPNDVKSLKRMIVELREQSAAEIARLKAEQQAAIDEAVKAAIAAILRRYYNPRSESFDPRQLLLFGLAVAQMPLDEASIAAESGEKLVTRRVANRHNHGRQQLPESLSGSRSSMIWTIRRARSAGMSARGSAPR